MNAKAERPFAHRYVAYALVLLAFALLVFQLNAKSLSGDEFGNVLIESNSLTNIFQHMASTWSQHPPGSHLIMQLWIGSTGTGDFAVRFLAICWATLSVVLLYRLGQNWFGAPVGLVAMGLLTVSPEFILYGRMEKYYSLVMMLVLISLILFERTIRRPHWTLFLLQGFISLLLLYTDYFAALFIVGVQNFIALLIWRRERRLIGWLIPQFIAVLIFLPFAGTVFAQIRSVAEGPEADLATGWLAVVSKLAYFPYAYSVGETLFPWALTALPSTVFFGVLALIGIRSTVRKTAGQWDKPPFWIVVFLFVTVIGSVVITSTILTAVSLITLPNHVLFALPFFILLVAVGLQQTGRWRRWLTGLAAILLMPSLFNYYTDQQFHNPVFVTPSREVMNYILTQSQPGDILISDEASGAQYYYRQWGLEQPILLTPPIDSTQINAEHVKRVWLVTVGRDRTRLVTPDPIVTELETKWRLVDSTGFGEQNEEYRMLKSRLTGRPAYQYRVVVQLFQRSSLPGDATSP